MKFFVMYGLARLALFAAVYGLLMLLVGPNIERTATNYLFLALVALAISAVLALVFLRSMRDRASVVLGERAAAMRQRFHDARSKEDID